MTSRTLALGAVATGAVLLAVQIWAKPRPTAEEIEAEARGFAEPAAWRGRVAPDFEVGLLDRSTFRLQDHIGRKVVVLNFFATWCGPCRAEMPELQRFQQEHAGNGLLLLLGIDAEEKHTVVEGFVAELKLTFPVGIDPSGDLLKLYDVDSFPTTVVIGADGRVKLYETGAITNADVALGPVVAPELAAVREGRGIATDAYLAALAADVTKPRRGGPLEGRARLIAEAMACPCGCEDKVSGCGCSTAKSIRARLSEGGFGDQSDEEVIQALNREYCVKGPQ